MLPNGSGRRRLPLNKLRAHGAQTEDLTRWDEELKEHRAKIYAFLKKTMKHRICGARNLASMTGEKNEKGMERLLL